MAGAHGVGVSCSLAQRQRFFPCCPYAYVLQEIRKVYCDPLNGFLGKLGLQDGSWPPRLNQGHPAFSRGALAVWDRIYPLCFLRSRAGCQLGWCTEICWDGASPRVKCLGVTNSHPSSQHSFPLSCSSPLPLFLPSAALSHPLLSCSAGDARAPGESQQPGWGPGLRVPRRQRELDGAAGFPPLLHRILRGARKRLEVPLQGLHQWRRYSIIPWSSHISPSLSWAGGMCL